MNEEFIMKEINSLKEEHGILHENIGGALRMFEEEREQLNTVKKEFLKTGYMPTKIFWTITGIGITVSIFVFGIALTMISANSTKIEDRSPTITENKTNIKVLKEDWVLAQPKLDKIPVIEERIRSVDTKIDSIITNFGIQ